MDPRRQVLSQAFNAFLDRYSPPRHMHDNPATMQAEADALFKVVMKFAPVTDYENWLDDVLEQLSYQMKTRAWPTVNEVGSAARNVRKEHHQKTPGPGVPERDPLRAVADKIRAGESVGDGFLYGRVAVDMIDAGFIYEDDLRRHRSALYFGMKDVWGQDVALAKEAEFKRRHETAQKMRADRRAKRDASIPDKHMPISQDERDEYRAGGWS